MLIGNQYAENKLYRGIVHYDSNPLTSGDIHEHTDTMYMKNAYLMNNLLGSGILNSPDILLLGADGIRLSEPYVVLLDGDIVLIHSDSNNPIVRNDSMEDASEEGIVYVLGWYQYISATSTIRSYGGLNNEILENDLLNQKFDRQISGRYQFRWYPIALDSDSLVSDRLSLSIQDRDIRGDVLETTSDISSNRKIGDIFVFDTPDSMNYASSELYLIPIMKYRFDKTSNTFIDMKSVDRGQIASLIVSETEPEGSMSNGIQWYNPVTREFKTYVRESGGFVSSTSKMAFLQYQSVYTMTERVEIPRDITIPINISELEEGDIVRVVYEGATLIEGDHYSINYQNHTITLREFTSNVGDHVYFTTTKIVEANDITSITATFVRHMDTTSSSTVEGHTKLSDTPSDSSASDGIAATPKLVANHTDKVKSDILSDTDNKISNTKKEIENDISEKVKILQKSISDSKLIRDTSNNTFYVLGIENGLVYIEEV